MPADWQRDEDDEELLAALGLPVELKALDDTDLDPDVLVLGPSPDLQQLLRRHGVEVVDTYPDWARPLMLRDIRRVRARELEAVDGSVFVKPALGHKLGPAGVWRRADWAGLPDCELLVSPLVSFEAEHRLYIGAVELRGVASYGDRLFPEDPWESPEELTARFEVLQRVEPPADFVQAVLSSVPRDLFCAVDVGLMTSRLDEEPHWAVVEVNPGFATVNYGLPAADFARFVTDAWRSMCKQI